MMETSAIGLGYAQLVYLFLFGSQFLGLPPGERDGELIKAAPAGAYAYFEWTAAGEGQRGAPGFEGLVADPEIQAFAAALQKSLADANPEADASGEIEATLRAEAPQLLWLLSRHPGCVYLAAGERPPGNRALDFPLEGAIVLNLGDDAEEFVAALNQVLSLLPDYEPVAHPQGQVVPVGGALVRLELFGPRLIIAVGEGSLERFHARWQQPLAELNDVPEYVNAGMAADVESLGSVMWWNLAAVRSDLPRLGLPGILLQGVAGAVGLTGIDSVMTVSGIEQHDLISRTQISLNGQRNGILTLLAGPPIHAADLANVPADADFVAAVSLDLVTVQQGLRQMFAFRPEFLASFDEFQRQLERELQLSFADVLHGFGNVWTVYDAPSTGGVFLTGMVAAAPVNDSNAAQAVVARFQKWLVDGLPDEMESGDSLKTLDFEGVAIHYLTSPDSPFSPAFCLTEQQLLVALHPQAIKAHLRFLKSSAPRFDQNMVRDFQPPQGDLLAGLFVDTPRLGQAIYPLLPLILKSAAAQDGGEFDIGAIPSAQSVLPYLRPASTAVVRRADGLFIEQRNMAPVTLALSLLPRLSGTLSPRSSGGDLAGGKGPVGAPAVQLGVPEGGVVQAKIEEPAAPEAAEPNAVEKAARRTLPFFVRTWIPDTVEGMIPPDVWQKMAQPPDPEAAAERAAARERRRAARAARRAARQGQ